MTEPYTEGKCELAMGGIKLCSRLQKEVGGGKKLIISLLHFADVGYRATVSISGTGLEFCPFCGGQIFLPAEKTGT